MRILVVEDEKRIADFLSRGLESGGYAVDVANDGNTAIELVHNTEYDLIILDLGLPDMDGLSVLQKIRNRKTSPPVLILSARDAVDDRVKGLEGGADDYLVKPFAFVELLARVRVLLRRGQPTPERLQVGELSLDCIRRKVTRSGENVELAPKEFSILEYLMRNRGRPLSRTMIVEHVWDMDYDGLTNIVDVYIRHLRSKIDDKWPEKMIQTVRGIGYMLDIPDKAGERALVKFMARFTRVFGVRQLRVGFVRGLRFRLAVSYVAFFAILLAAIGFFFWRHLKEEAEADVRDHGRSGLGRDRRISSNSTTSVPNGSTIAAIPTRPYTVERLRHVYLLTDANGNRAAKLDHLRLHRHRYGRNRATDSARISTTRSRDREYSIQKDEDGIPYMIRAGWTLDDHKHKYFLAIGRSLAVPYRTVESFTRTYLLLAPAMLVLASFFGWWLAGVAIQPVNSVAHAAQNVTGSNSHSANSSARRGRRTRSPDR